MKPNDLVFVKTTSEEVLVLAVDKKSEPAFPGLSGVQVTVSRPMLGQDGVRHVADVFLLEQLETLEERFKREYETRNRVRECEKQMAGQTEEVQKAVLPN